VFEKRLAAVPPQAFIADGTDRGIITLADTRFFKVKQQVILMASALPNLDAIEVKKVISPTQIMVGPTGPDINKYQDVSAYTTAALSFIFANEQKRPSIPFEESTRAVYEEEPVVALRVIPVDEYGDKYNSGNRFPVDAIVNFTASQPSVHTIFNKLVTTANSEVSVILPNKTEIFTIMVRSNKAIKLQYSFTVGESGTKFITVNPGVRKEVSGVGLVGATPLYFQLSSTEVGGTIVEVETWNS